MKRILAFVLALLAFPASAQAVDYTCTAAAGMAIYSFDTVPPGTNQPTACRLLSNGVQISSGPTVLSSTLSVPASTPCQPLRANYNPGPAGSVACALGTGNLSPGTYSFTFYWSNAAGEVGPSPPVVIQVVTALPSTPPTPVSKPVPR
jgi:hypothetical protein